MKCENCAYWWKGQYDDRPSCHYHSITEWAPCELASNEAELDEYEEEMETY